MSSGEKCGWWPTVSAQHSFVSGMVFELFCFGLTTITTSEAQLVFRRQKCSNPLMWKKGLYRHNYKKIDQLKKFKSHQSRGKKAVANLFVVLDDSEVLIWNTKLQKENGPLCGIRFKLLHNKIFWINWIKVSVWVLFLWRNRTALLRQHLMWITLIDVLTELVLKALSLIPIAF